jgi:uncharacterized Zn finger protein (UPF0148 family)
MNKVLFNGIIEMNEAYKDRLQCVCEENMDMMTGKWFCPRCGHREPNYQALFEAEEREHLEKKIMAAEFRRDEKREEEMMKRLPGDHEGTPSNEQMEMFKRGYR